MSMTDQDRADVEFACRSYSKKFIAIGFAAGLIAGLVAAFFAYHLRCGAIL